MISGRTNKYEGHLVLLACWNSHQVFWVLSFQLVDMGLFFPFHSLMGHRGAVKGLFVAGGDYFGNQLIACSLMLGDGFNFCQIGLDLRFRDAQYMITLRFLLWTAVRRILFLQ